MSGGNYGYAFTHTVVFVNDCRNNVDNQAPNQAKRAAFLDLLEHCADAMRAIEWNDSGDGADEEVAIDKCLNFQAKIP